MMAADGETPRRAAPIRITGTLALDPGTTAARGIDPFLRIKPRDAKEREKTDLVAIGGYHDIGEERGKWEKKKK